MKMAEGEGFEPPVALRPQRFSRPLARPAACREFLNVLAFTTAYNHDVERGFDALTRTVNMELLHFCFRKQQRKLACCLNACSTKQACDTPGWKASMEISQSFS